MTKEEYCPQKEVEVVVTLTISKPVKVYIDYDTEYINHEEDLDISINDLREAVEDQIVLPPNLALFTERMFDSSVSLKAAGMPMYLRQAIRDCKDWTIDDIEISKE